MTDTNRAEPMKRLAERLREFRNAHWTHWTAAENRLIEDVGAALRAEVEASRLPLAGAATSDAVFLIYYDDHDRRPQIVIGEEGARAQFERISTAWNAHLFGKIESNCRDDRYYSNNIALASPAPSDAAVQPVALQQRVQPWMMACFGPEISADIIERNHRFLEESLELVQSTGCTQSEAHQLVDYVYGRPSGETSQEVGGVMITLAALCLARGEDMHACGETELARIWTKVDTIRAKQAAKPKHSPLPTSPLPTAPAGAREAMEKALDALKVGWVYTRNRTADGAKDANTIHAAIVGLRAALAAAPLERIALSDERLIEMAKLVWTGLPAEWWDRDRNDIRGCCLSFARAIEAEHGITLALQGEAKGDGNG